VPVKEANAGGCLVFQGHHGLIAAAEGGDVLEASGWMFQQHDRTVAEDGMTAFRHVPRPADARLRSHGMIEGRAQ
jgi:hypothetical protein